MSKIIRCTRCNRRHRNQADWNAIFDDGHPVAYLCPDCQTPEENAEAVINEATLHYFRRPETGQYAAVPK